MDAPGTSGRPPAGFASLSAWSLLCSTPVSGRQQNLSSESHVDYSSQQSLAPTRVPTTAWFPSFGRGGSVSNNWSNRPSSHKTFSYGLGTGAGGSMLVSLLPMLAYSNIDTRFISITRSFRLASILLQHGGFGSTQAAGLWPFKSKGISSIVTY